MGFPAFTLNGIDHVALAVPAVEPSARWYCDVLGLERRYQEAWGNHPAVVGIGTTSLALFPVAGPSPQPRPGRDVLTMRHLAFRASRREFDQARAPIQNLCHVARAVILDPRGRAG